MGNRRYFCCCIPVRAAVFITSFLSLIGTGLAAGVAFWLVHAIDTRPDLLDDTQIKITSGARIGIIITGVVFAIIAIISLFGFIGSVIRNRRMVKLYSILVWLCFFFSVALTAFTCYLVFSKSSLIQCYDKDLNEVACSSVFNKGRKIGLVVSSVIGLLFQLYICVVIRRYVEQLEDEQAYKHDFGLNKKNNTSYYPFQSIESRNGLLDNKH
jgi:MFS family permease